MRRVFRWHAAVLTTVGLFVGCDDGSGPSATPSKNAAADAAPAVGADEKAPAKRNLRNSPKGTLSPTKAD